MNGFKKDTGPYLVQRLREVLGDHPLTGEIRGFGPAGGNRDRQRSGHEGAFFEPAGHAAGLVRDHSIANGLMMRAVGETMILSPPLTWTRDTIDEAAQIAKTAFDLAQGELTA